jgi:hypothetical protein
MKVKLLKKIRKNYIITRVDELPSNPSDCMDDAKIEFGLPFYMLAMVDDPYSFPSYHKNFDIAREELWKLIFNKYGEKFRHKDGKSEIVWWKQ